MLVAYFHMWHDGQAWPGQCEGCTFCASQIQRPEYLHSRDITLAVFCEGSYDESRPYADFLGYVTPWYSARDSAEVVAVATSASTPATSATTTVGSSRPTGPPTAGPRSRSGATA